MLTHSSPQPSLPFTDGKEMVDGYSACVGPFWILVGSVRVLELWEVFSTGV